MSGAVGERWQTRIKSINEGVRHIHNTKEFWDVVFIVRGERFEAHKLVLASRSSELARRLMSPNATEEQIVDRTSPVTVLGFKTLLNFCYTGDLDTSDKRAVVDGYLAADYYRQRSLKELCVQTFNTWDIKPEEVCELLDIEADIPALKEKCISIVRSNGIAVLASDAFCRSSLKCVSAILCSGAVRNVPAFQRIEYFMKWGKFQHPSAADYSAVRELLLKHEPPLLGKLEFENLDLKELRKIPKLFPKLLTAEESTGFFVYSDERDASDLPDWCNPVD